MIEQYQTRVLGPTECVNYSETIKASYPPVAVQREPFVGFKVLCKDTVGAVNQMERLRYIDANLGFLRGKGCIIRETNSTQMPDGFWVIAFPVPRSQANQQLMNLMEVLSVFERFFGIVRQDLVEVNVSGRCSYMETENCLRGIFIPQAYSSKLIPPTNSPYRFGTVTRINQMFMILRTRWNLKNPDDIMVLAQILSSIYH